MIFAADQFVNCSESDKGPPRCTFSAADPYFMHEAG